MSLTNLPAEIITRVIGLTDPADVRICSQVSRLFRSLVKSQICLEYMLELDISGYALPSVPRTDISYAQKIEILRERRKNRRENEFVEPFFVPNSGEYRSRTYFVQGTVAFGSVDNPYSMLVRRIEFHRLPSRNQGTEHKHWKHDFGFDAIAVAMHPDLDLLVAVEQLPGETAAAPVCTRFKVHLLAISNCEPHPGLESPNGSLLDLCYTPDLSNFHSTFVSCDIWIYNHLLAVKVGSAEHGRFGYFYFVVWDWVMGKELAHVETKNLQHDSFSFLSEDYFVILCDIPAGSSRLDYNPLGYFDVYHISPANPSTRFSPSQPIARLALPVLHKTQDYVATELMSTRVLTTPSLCRLTYPPPVPKIYELPSDGHILCLDIRIIAELDDGEQLRGQGSLFVVSTLLLDTLNRSMKDSAHPADQSSITMPIISWESWCSCTRYVDCPPGLCQIRDCLSGLLWAGAVGSDIMIFDFSSRRLRVQETQRDTPREEEVIPPAIAQLGEGSHARGRPSTLRQLFVGEGDPGYHLQYTRRILTASNFLDYRNLFVLTGSEHVTGTSFIVGVLAVEESPSPGGTSRNGLCAYEV